MQIPSRWSGELAWMGNATCAGRPASSAFSSAAWKPSVSWIRWSTVTNMSHPAASSDLPVRLKDRMPRRASPARHLLLGVTIRPRTKEITQAHASALAPEGARSRDPERPWSRLPTHVSEFVTTPLPVAWGCGDSPGVVEACPDAELGGRIRSRERRLGDRHAEELAQRRPTLCHVEDQQLR